MPKLLTTPFASDASSEYRTDIQNSAGADTNSATYEKGFPPNTMIKITEGGKPPKGSDMNGVLYDITDNLVSLTKGARYGFNDTYANAIGGYPQGAVLRLENGVEVESEVNSNTTNPNNDMTGWKLSVSDVGVATEDGGNQRIFNADLKQSVNSKADLTYVNNALSGLSSEATKFYPTLAQGNADIANLSVNQPVQIGDAVDGGLYYKATQEATSLTKSPWDAVTQATLKATKRTNYLKTLGKKPSNIQNVAQFENGDLVQSIKVDTTISLTEQVKITSATITNNSKVLQTFKINDFEYPLMPSDVMTSSVLSKYVDFSILNTMTISVQERTSVYSVRINFDTSGYSVSATDQANAIDDNFIYQPTQATVPETSFLSLSAISTGLQFNIPKQILLDNGYDIDAKQFLLDTLPFIKVRIRHATSTKTISMGLTNKLLQSESHSVLFGGNTGNITLYAAKKMPISTAIIGQAYTLYSTSAQNNSSLEKTNDIVELKANFKIGEVFSNDQIVVKNKNGATFDCQFAPDFFANVSYQLSDGYHPDGSFKSGSILIRDSFLVDEVKSYDILVYQNAVVERSQAVKESETSNRKVFKAYGHEMRFVKDYTTGNNFAEVANLNGDILQSITSEQIVTNSGGNLIYSGLSGTRTLKVLSAGQLFTDVECVIKASAYPIEIKQIYRMFSDADLRVFSIKTLTGDIASTACYGIQTQIWNNESTATQETGSTPYSIMHLDKNGKDYYLKAIAFHGDVNRDGLTYGALRPAFYSSAGKLMRFGWQDSIGSQSSTTWTTIKVGTCWITEFIITNKTTLDYKQFAGNIFNTASGFTGEKKTWQEKSKSLINDVAQYVIDTKDWWYSPDAANVGGNPTAPTSSGFVECADLIDLYLNNVGDFNTLYNRFIARTKARHGATLANIGQSYLNGTFQIAIESRVTAPNLWWLYKHAEKNSDTAKTSELKIIAKSITDVLVSYFDINGGIGNNGNGTDKGASNINASGSRFIAIAIAMGLDASGDYLRVFNAIEQLLISEQFQPIKNYISDGRNQAEASSRYLAYTAYAFNSYLLGCIAIDRAPLVDVTQYTLNALNSNGDMRSLEWNISESRRGGRNTVGLFLQPLVYKRQVGTVNAAIESFESLKRNGWDQEGYPLRINGFKANTASGDNRSDCLYNLSALSDLYLTYSYV